MDVAISVSCHHPSGDFGTWLYCSNASTTLSGLDIILVASVGAFGLRRFISNNQPAIFTAGMADVGRMDDHFSVTGGEAAEISRILVHAMAGLYSGLRARYSVKTLLEWHG